jgi:hypothetical protein
LKGDKGRQEADKRQTKADKRETKADKRETKGDKGGDTINTRNTRFAQRICNEK